MHGILALIPSKSSLARRYSLNRQARAEAVSALIFVLQSDAALAFGLIAAIDGELAPIVIVAAHPTRKLKNRDFVNGLLILLCHKSRQIVHHKHPH
jgi:hypothetical protein